MFLHYHLEFSPPSGIIPIGHPAHQPEILESSSVGQYGFSIHGVPAATYFGNELRLDYQLITDLMLRPLAAF